MRDFSPGVCGPARPNIHHGHARVNQRLDSAKACGDMKPLQGPHSVGPPDAAALLDAIAEGLYVVDRDRVISHWNRAAEEITGYPASVTTGLWCGDGLLNHVDEEGTPLCGVSCPLLDTMSDGVPRQARVYAHHRDGHLVPVRIAVRALRDVHGEITGAVETFTDDSQMELAQLRLREAQRLAMTDPLTGLGNRRFLEERLAFRLEEAARDAQCAVIVVDIDRFKRFNDDHGHVFGDGVLEIVAKTLAHVAGGGVDVARSGGDEFVVVTGPTTADALAALARRIRFTVAEARIADGDVAMALTVSVGAALSREGDEPWTLVERADEAMLAAKRGGRNAVAIADENLRIDNDDRTRRATVER